MEEGVNTQLAYMDLLRRGVITPLTVGIYGGGGYTIAHIHGFMGEGIQPITCMNIWRRGRSYPLTYKDL